MRQELVASQDAAPAEEGQTSAKFSELARIIHGLGESERVLVVSPLRSMLDDVRAQMAKLGVPLAILRGGAMEQQNTLKAWQKWGVQGAPERP